MYLFEMKGGRRKRRGGSLASSNKNQGKKGGAIDGAINFVLWKWRLV